MSAQPRHDDRRPVPTVAIIGNDAVLLAAPATPVQLAHACLRRGFSVAVPVSWGDELVAAEAMRRLASKDRGPAVMCVCPFVRSRLLAPGPDLAPFLVSVIAPPVATARYLRTIYGEHGLHITYIGGCPSADDPSIDARLTSDAFLADLADQGIALAEQPLVFDSIVPPDRRRWCSLPGGTPTAEVLWSEADGRTLIEIERDDASTELAQHIIGHEHVLLDLAPALGCVCSGAIGSVPARSARVAVTSVEPPRAFGPIVDPALVVSLDAPVADHAQRPSISPGGPPPQPELMALRLDELLGAQATPLGFPVEDRGENVEPTAAIRAVNGDPAAPVDESPLRTEVTAPSEPQPVAPPDVVSPAHAEDLAASSSVSTEMGSEQSQPEPPTDIVTPTESEATPDEPYRRVTVRRRTPASSHTRHPGSSIPKTTASDGRALPRAYVAKRRTPAVGMPAVPSMVDPGVSATTPPEAAQPVSVLTRSADAESRAEPISRGDATISSKVPESIGEPPSDPVSQPASDVSANAQPQGDPTDNPSTIDRVGAESLASATVAPVESVPVVSASVPQIPPNNGTARENAPQPESNHGGGAAAASAPNPSAFVILLLALIALAIFVLRSLG